MVSGITTNNFLPGVEQPYLMILAHAFLWGVSGGKKKPQESWKTATQYSVESKLVLISFIWKERLVFMQMNTCSFGQVQEDLNQFP